MQWGVKYLNDNYIYMYMYTQIYIYKIKGHIKKQVNKKK